MKKAIILFLCLTLLFCSCSFSQESSEEERFDSSSSLSVSQMPESSESSRESTSKSESSSLASSEDSVSHIQSSDSSSLESQSSESSSDIQSTASSSESSAFQSSQAQPSSGTLVQQSESSGALTGDANAPEEETLSGYGGIEFLSGDESAVLEKINQLRQSLGLSSLVYDSSLQQAARIRSQEMCVNNYFAHSRPDGSSWQTVVDQDVPIAYRIVGENLAAVNTNDPAAQSVSSSQWLEMWRNSSSHYATMTDGRYTHAGVGICYTVDSDGLFRIYATVLFCQY